MSARDSDGRHQWREWRGKFVDPSADVPDISGRRPPLAQWYPEGGTTVVTVNATLARVLTYGYEQGQLGLGRGAWDSPDILAHSAWLERLWCTAEDQGLTGLTLLRPEQEGVLWERAIGASRWGDGSENDPEGDVTWPLASPMGSLPMASLSMASLPMESLPMGSLPMGSLQGAVAAAARAYEVMVAYRGSWPALDTGMEGAMFSRWVEEFRALCANGEWLPRAALAQWLVGVVHELRPALPKSVVYAGFQHLSPVQQELFKALEGCAVKVERWAPAQIPNPDLFNPDLSNRDLSNPELGRMVFDDEEQELYAAANWARGWLSEARAQGLNRALHLAVVVPELAAKRDLVGDIFEHVFAPDLGGPQLSGEEVPAFGIGVGEPLAGSTVVADALAALDLLAPGFDRGALSRFLLSPYFQPHPLQTEPPVAADPDLAQLDARLRRDAEVRLTRQVLVQFLPSDSPPPPRLRTLLEDSRAQSVDSRVPSSLSEWCERFQDYWSALGWPYGTEGEGVGVEVLHPSERRAVDGLATVLERLAALDAVAPSHTFAQALARLRRLVADTPLHTRPVGAPVQVVGVHESAGLQCDGLWVTGLHVNAWPLPAQPVPFVPWKLQRQWGFPLCDATSALDHARWLMQHWCASAGSLVVSSPGLQRDEAVAPSPLIEPIAVREPPVSVEDYAERIQRAAPTLVPLASQPGPRLAAKEKTSGGASLLSAQSACPFKAYAVHRLRAAKLEGRRSGMDARGRGVLVHRILEDVWRELGSHRALLELDHSAQKTMVAATVERNLDNYARRYPYGLRPRLRALESKRLSQLLDSWLHLERDREPFEVAAPEESHTIMLRGLRLKLRPDRVDRLGDGTLVVMDYKTGKVERGAWLEERLDEPQLPLYAVALNGAWGRSGEVTRDPTGEDSVAVNVGAVTFALLRPNELGWRGLGAATPMAGVDTVNASRLRGLKSQAITTWEALLGSWETWLGDLAESFVQGTAEVDPKKGPTTCRRCGLQSLCRVYEIPES